MIQPISNGSRKAGQVASQKQFELMHGNGIPEDCKVSCKYKLRECEVDKKKANICPRPKISIRWDKWFKKAFSFFRYLKKYGKESNK